MQVDACHLFSLHCFTTITPYVPYMPYICHICHICFTTITPYICEIPLTPLLQMWMDLYPMLTPGSFARFYGGRKPTSAIIHFFPPIANADAPVITDFYQIAKVSSVHCSTSGLALGSPGCLSFVRRSFVVTMPEIPFKPLQCYIFEKPRVQGHQK